MQKNVNLIRNLFREGAVFMIGISVFLLILKGLKYILNIWSVWDCLIGICLGVLILLATIRTNEKEQSEESCNEEKEIK